jgi:hypothetical protein
MEHSHLLSLMEHEETTNKLSELTKRFYRLEKENGRTTRILLIQLYFRSLSHSYTKKFGVSYL